jgi:hypothetical protein
MKTQEEFLAKVWEITQDWVEGQWTFDVFQEGFLKAFNEFETNREDVAAIREEAFWRGFNNSAYDKREDYVIGIDPSTGGTSIGYTLNTSI